MRDFETGLTADEVRRRFRYVKSTGKFIRRVPVFGATGGIQHHVGSVAGSLHHDGYVYLGIDGRLYLAHRLAWLWVTGSWPIKDIDHKNGVRSDNQWKNLRDATVRQNRQNTLGQLSRTNKYPGVYRHSLMRDRFVAQIKHQGKVLYLGCFSDEDVARLVRVEAEKVLFGEFAGSARERF